MVSNARMKQKVYPLTVSGSGLEGKATLVMLWWGFAPNYALKSTKTTKRTTLYNNKQKSPDHSPHPHGRLQLSRHPACVDDPGDF